MFGLGRKVKEAVVEEVVPPTHSSAAVEIVQEFLAPAKDFFSSIEWKADTVFVVFASALLLSISFAALLRPKPPASAPALAVVEEENEAIAEEVTKEAGDESSQADSLTAASSSSSSSSSNAGDDDSDGVSDAAQDDDQPVEETPIEAAIETPADGVSVATVSYDDASAEARVVAQGVLREAGDESTLALTAASSGDGEGAYDDFLLGAAASEDSEDYRAFEAHVSKMRTKTPPGTVKGPAADDVAAKPLPSEDEVSALGTSSKDSSDGTPSPPETEAPDAKAPEAKAASAKPRASKPRRRLPKGRSSTAIIKSGSNNSLGSLKRASMRKLKSVKKVFK